MRVETARRAQVVVSGPPLSRSSSPPIPLTLTSRTSMSSSSVSVPMAASARPRRFSRPGTVMPRPKRAPRPSVVEAAGWGGPRRAGRLTGAAPSEVGRAPARAEEAAPGRAANRVPAPGTLWPAPRRWATPVWARKAMVSKRERGIGAGRKRPQKKSGLRQGAKKGIERFRR